VTLDLRRGEPNNLCNASEGLRRWKGDIWVATNMEYLESMPVMKNLD